MGLSIDYDIWEGSCTGFNEFRRALMSAADMEEPDYNKYKWYHFRGMWKQVPKDPLTILIVHSDCDGYLFIENYHVLRGRLVELRPKMAAEWLPELENWIDGLQKALEDRVILRFH